MLDVIPLVVQRAAVLFGIFLLGLVLEWLSLRVHAKLAYAAFGLAIVMLVQETGGLLWLAATGVFVPVTFVIRQSMYKDGVLMGMFHVAVRAMMTALLIGFGIGSGLAVAKSATVLVGVTSATVGPPSWQVFVVAVLGYVIGTSGAVVLIRRTRATRPL